MTENQPDDSQESTPFPMVIPLDSLPTLMQLRSK
jgi:hypothetical protein